MAGVATDRKELTRAYYVSCGRGRGALLMGTLNAVRGPPLRSVEMREWKECTELRVCGLVSWEAGGVTDTQIGGKKLASGLEAVSK